MQSDKARHSVASIFLKPTLAKDLNRRLEWIQFAMISDTHPKAALVQQEIFRRMTTSERLRMALEMSESMRNVALAGLRSRCPELNEEELSRELLRIMYGFTPPL